MVEVIVFAEGQSEELFLKLLVAPVLREKQIFLKPRLMETSRGHVGGGINFDRLCSYVCDTLRDSKLTKAYLSTFFDLYGLGTSMPGYEGLAQFNAPQDKARHVETELHRALLAKVGFRADRFIPHIQPYELEALFFSDTHALCRAEPAWAHAAGKLEKVRKEFPSPEHINNSIATAPSKRLEALLTPTYRKTRHTPLIAQSIGLTTMRQECAHFAAWMDKMESLRPL